MMQNYNNYGNNNYGSFNSVQQNRFSNGMNVRNNSWDSGNGNAGMGYQANNMNGYGQVPQFVDDRVFVAGRIGADAYQLPQGVNVQVLWDDEANRFYVKGYDEKGRLRVLADNDYQPHVDPEPQQVNVDMSMYATKDDIKNMISEALKKSKSNNYVTVDQFNKTLSELCVGSGGKVVRTNESDA